MRSTTRHWPIGQILHVLWLALLASNLPRAGAEERHDEIGPPDVYMQVAVVRDELEAIRFVMGRPKDEQRQIRVRGAAAREVYFQALTLFRKAERLCFEQTRDRAEEPSSPEHALTSRDVSVVVERALERIRKVEQRLGIRQRATPPARDGTKISTDVFRSIIQANRQLNLLLERRFTPSDVFAQVTRGVSAASRLLERFPTARPIPPAPEVEIGKRPGDVYRRLLACFEHIRNIAEISGEHVLEFEADDQQVDSAEPSDVYDVASLLVSELTYLQSRAHAQAARKTYYPGRKFPSHVYQRAGLLEHQLSELESFVRRNPDWLTRPGQGS